MKILKTIAFVLFISLGLQVTAQNRTSKSNWTKEEVKQELIDGFASFVESVRPFYQKGDSYAQFLEKVFFGTNNSNNKVIPILPPAGDGLLKKAYDYLSRGYTNSQIISIGNYEAMGNAVLFYDEEQKKIGKNADRSEIEVALFGGNATILESNSMLANRGRCRWYELSCHLDSIFGEGNGNTVMQAILTWLLPLLTGG